MAVRGAGRQGSIWCPGASGEHEHAAAGREQGDRHGIRAQRGREQASGRADRVEAGASLTICWSIFWAPLGHILNHRA